ncbi:MAG: DUF438 domain-containing protein [Vicinamibacteraceae bacterium]|nr:DUF438 domain-containing protein [Vicinamibacteraceae bacterium]
MSEIINNREQRITQLKTIIRHLHEGKPADEVRALLATIVGQTDHAEIAAMEQQLMAEGMAVEEVRSMCDLHADVLRDVMTPVQIRPKIVPGHPVDTFQRENRAIADVTRRLREEFARLAAVPDEGDATPIVEACRAHVNALFDVEKHYQRKELLLFTFLEQHGITGPSKVMWAKDDEVRALLKDLAAALRTDGVSTAEWKLVAQTVGEQLVEAVDGMIYKEEQILLPLALDMLTREEWGRIWADSPRLGWCLVEPGDEYRPPAAVQPTETVEVPQGRAMTFPTGHLTFEQLRGIFESLPVDLTFVDADDRVAFYSEGPHRVFARSRAVIGRQVQHCHPPRSVSTVDRILDDFRAGRQDVAEFWIEFHGRFVHIRYFAVRSDEGKYLGCLEVTQDATALRALTGERRLLEYDVPVS